MNNSLCKRLENYIALSESLISEDGLQEVKHFFEHDEYEMAFEGLVIELMTINKYPEQYNYEEWKNMALKFGLDKESVFDGEFWNKFEKWGRKYNNTMHK